MKIFHTVLLCIITVITATANNKYEAEDAKLYGVQIKTSIKGYSGTGYVDGFNNEGDKVVFNFDWEKAGKYQLYIGYAATSGNKNNYVYVNSENIGNLLFEKSSSFKELNAGKIRLKKGNNIISIEKSWGWFQLDYIRIDKAEESVEWNLSNTPVNPNATPEVKALLNFLIENFGKNTLSGQYISGDKMYNESGSEMRFLDIISGKYPAVYGTDLIDYSPSRVERGSKSNVVNASIKYYEEQNGIITMSWHWNAPTDLYDTEENPWWSGFYTRATSFNIKEVLADTTSERYKLIIRDIDVIAEKLRILQDKNIPILWRPLHEAEGAWFWWGAQGAEPCVELWKLLYDRLTNHHKINNLLWVWTTTDSPNALDWYPGDDYVDILGVDVYLNDGDYSASTTMFDNLRNMFQGKKLLTMSENGTIPDPDKMYSQGAPWSYFCTWSGNFINDGKKNSHEHIHTVFNHEKIITIDELDTNWHGNTNNKTQKEIKGTSLLYPNPFSKQINIKISIEKPVTITIDSFNGQQMFQQEYSEISSPLSLATEHYPSGLYAITIRSEKASEIFKMIKQ